MIDFPPLFLHSLLFFPSPFALLFSHSQLYPVFTLNKFTFGVGNVIPLILLFIVRLLYFILLATGALSVNENNLGVFILVELPILLYLTTTAYFVVNWYVPRFPLAISLHFFGKLLSSSFSSPLQFVLISNTGCSLLALSRNWEMRGSWDRRSSKASFS